MRLADQDRSLWDAAMIAEGHALVRRCLRRGAPGPYQLQAAINAVHTDAADAADTDWSQVVALYDHLLRLAPTDVVRLNRAVAVAELDGPQVALGLLDGLDLDGIRPLPCRASRAARPAGATGRVRGRVGAGGRASADNAPQARHLRARAANAAARAQVTGGNLPS